MGAYIARRLIGLAAILVVVGFMAFLLVHLTPGDPAAIMLGPEATSQDIARLRGELGLDSPLHVQLCTWFLRALHGDFGKSYYYGTAVSREFLGRLEPTLLLTALAVIVAVVTGIPLGILAALRHNSIIDQASMTLAVVGVSMPQFWLALNLILLFSVRYGWLPATGYTFVRDGICSTLRYLALPALALGLGQAALIARMTRASLLEVMRSDYVRTARAKGVRQCRVILLHALRNTAVDILTIVGLSIIICISGVFVIEILFSLPGVGRLVVGAVRRRDFPVIQGALVYIGGFIALVNLAVDLLYAWMDPRVRLS